MEQFFVPHNCFTSSFISAAYFGLVVTNAILATKLQQKIAWYYAKEFGRRAYGNLMHNMQPEYSPAC